MTTSATRASGYLQLMAALTPVQGGSLLKGATKLEGMVLNAEQSRVLKKIIPPKFSKEIQAKLEEFIRVSLEIIRKAAEAENTTGRKIKASPIYNQLLALGSGMYAPPRAVTSALVRDVRRFAESAETMAGTLRRQQRKLKSHLYPGLPSPPITELARYAHDMRTAADDLSKRTQDRVRIAVKRKPRESSEEIVGLAQFVHNVTEKRHWEALSKLISAAVGDVGFNQDRLRKLVTYHECNKKTPKNIVGCFKKQDSSAKQSL